MRKIFKILFLFIALIQMSEARAAFSPLAFSILAPVQFPPRDFSVVGARFSAFWGEHRDVYGFDIAAIGNITDQQFGGVAVSGIFNWNKGMSTVIGLQAAGLANINVNKADIFGLQVSAGLNSNLAESKVVGFQIALANYSPFTKVYGIQAGAYNRANHVYGFQVGIVNVADSLHGIQIGLLNFNRTGLFSVAPFLNIGF